MNIAIIIFLGLIFLCITVVNIINTTIISKQKEGLRSVIFTLLLFSCLLYGSFFIYMIIILISDEDGSDVSNIILFKLVFALSLYLLFTSSFCLIYFNIKYKNDKNMENWKKDFFIVSNTFLLLIGLFCISLSRI